MSKRDVYSFRNMVNNDEGLQQRILAGGDVLKIAREKGLSISAAELIEVADELGSRMTTFEKKAVSGNFDILIPGLKDAGLGPLPCEYGCCV